MTDLFNNREIATGVWLLVFVVLVAKKASMRDAFLKVLKAFLHWKLILPVFLMAGYLGLEVLLLQQWDLWNISLLKDTIYWFFLTGFVLLTKFMGEKQDVRFFRKTLLQCFAIAAFLQFLLNLYTFPLWGELIFIPAIAFLGAASVLTETDPDCAPAKSFFEWVQAIIGIIMVIYLVRMTWLHHSELSPSNLLLSVLLPILLTFLFFPFLYVTKLIANYEMFFVRLGFHISDDDNLLSYTRLKTLLHCHINLPRLDRFEKFLLAHVWDTRDRDGINRIITNFKSGQNYDC